MKTITSLKWSSGEKSLIMLTVFLFTYQILLSNSPSIQLSAVTQRGSFLSLFDMGFKQFTTGGVKSMLFVLSFFLLCPKKKDASRQAFIFAGSFLFSELLTVFGFVEPNTYILNSLVFLTILFIAAENVFARKLKIESTRSLFVFLFGLIHGTSLGNALVNSGAAEASPLFSFFSYSVGLVMGELSVLGILLLVIGKLFADKSYYKIAIANPLSLGLVAYSIYNVVRLLTMPN
jgi:hypothetical protein